MGAVRTVLERAGMTIDEIDLFEINEAFAAVVMAAMTELELPVEKVNVSGGAVALGFAATFFHSAQNALDEGARLPYSRGARITPTRLGDEGPLVGAGAVGWRGLRRSMKARRAAEAETEAEAQPPNER